MTCLLFVSERKELVVIRSGSDLITPHKEVAREGTSAKSFLDRQPGIPYTSPRITSLAFAMTKATIPQMTKKIASLTLAMTGRERRGI